MVSENDTPSSSASLRAKILRCFAKKYILLCLLCGGLCLTLGVLYLVIFFLLTRYTTSLHYFQTLPTYIPAVVVSISCNGNTTYTLGKLGIHLQSERWAHRTMAIKDIIWLWKSNYLRYQYLQHSINNGTHSKYINTRTPGIPPTNVKTNRFIIW